jgi:predicted NUDIX family NTP pyrophosphohydrolase
MPKARVDIEQKTHQAATPQSVNRNAARSNVSAGILAYRRAKRGLEILLVHPGGPFWRNKDEGAWSIPKGEINATEDPEQAARREFAEELGATAMVGALDALGEIRQRGGKRVIAFCGEADFDPAKLSSNTFDIEWPPRSGRRQSFPEVDRAEWFNIEFARTKMLSGQIELLDRLLAIAGESVGK